MELTPGLARTRTILKGSLWLWPLNLKGLSTHSVSWTKSKINSSKSETKLQMDELQPKAQHTRITKKKELLTYTALLMLKIKRLNATHCQPRRIHTQSITNPHPDTQSNNGEHFSSLQCMYRCIYIIYNVCTGIFAASNSTQEILSPWSLHGTSLLNTLGPTGRHDQTEDWGFYLKCTTDYHA